MLYLAQASTEGMPASQWIILGLVAAVAVWVLVVGRKKHDNC